MHKLQPNNSMEDYAFDQFLNDPEEVSFYTEFESDELEIEEMNQSEAFDGKTVLD